MLWILLFWVFHLYFLISFSVKQGGIFQVKFKFPNNYPYSPPEMTFITPMWHPNIYPDGRVCISILHQPGEDEFNPMEKASERWNPILGVKEILLSVISMLNDPNIESPANVDASVKILFFASSIGVLWKQVQFKNDIEGYNKKKNEAPKNSTSKRNFSLEKKKGESPGFLGFLNSQYFGHGAILKIGAMVPFIGMYSRGTELDSNPLQSSFTKAFYARIVENLRGRVGEFEFMKNNNLDERIVGSIFEEWQKKIRESGIAEHQNSQRKKEKPLVIFPNIGTNGVGRKDSHSNTMERSLAGSTRESSMDFQMRESGYLRGIGRTEQHFDLNFQKENETDELFDAKIEENINLAGGRQREERGFMQNSQIGIYSRGERKDESNLGSAVTSANSYRSAKKRQETSSSYLVKREYGDFGETQSTMLVQESQFSSILPLKIHEKQKNKEESSVLTHLMDSDMLMGFEEDGDTKETHSNTIGSGYFQPQSNGGTYGQIQKFYPESENNGAFQRTREPEKTLEEKDEDAELMRLIEEEEHEAEMQLCDEEEELEELKKIKNQMIGYYVQDAVRKKGKFVMELKNCVATLEISGSQKEFAFETVKGEFQWP